MYEQLRRHIQSLIEISDDELNLVDLFFERQIIPRKKFLLQEGNVCRFVAFVEQGTIRHFHTKNGNEKTCDISFEGRWVTDFQSFNTQQPAVINLQAMEDSSLLIISRDQLTTLYTQYPKYETFGRLIAEQIAQRATEIAMSLSSERPEERFRNLMLNQADMFQRVPQKYIANFLGVSPETLSRIRLRILKREKS
ncbi:MAG: Crp/Fnr family transcriptional regulator [Bacteroidetes bacterium]|nr:Crp/Fnr family transcriptional regulator [Bacteroidota bacterium]